MNKAIVTNEQRPIIPAYEMKTCQIARKVDTCQFIMRTHTGFVDLENGYTWPPSANFTVQLLEPGIVIELTVGA